MAPLHASMHLARHCCVRCVDAAANRCHADDDEMFWDNLSPHCVSGCFRCSSEAVTQVLYCNPAATPSHEDDHSGECLIPSSDSPPDDLSSMDGPQIA